MILFDEIEEVPEEKYKKIDPPFIEHGYMQEYKCDWYSEENQENIEQRGLEADHEDETKPAEDNDPIQD